MEGEGIRTAEGEERDERELGGVGGKRRKQHLAWFEALVVCGEVFFFFSSPFSRETMTELSVGVFVLDILIVFFFLFHPFKLL